VRQREYWRHVNPDRRVIEKSAHPAVAPNVQDYDAFCASFSWSRAERVLDGLPAGAGLNIAHEAVDRHAAGFHRAPPSDPLASGLS
jgi:hypothetical protein